MVASRSSSAAAGLLARVLRELELPAPADRMAERPPHPVPLSSRLATADLAWASVRAVAEAAGIRTLPDPDHVASAYRSDRVLTVDGFAPDVWSPYSGFWQTRDGWIRTHGNYPHHAARLLSALGLSPGASEQDLRETLAERTARTAVAAITAAGGMAVVVGDEDFLRDSALRTTPLISVRRLDGEPGDAVPLDGDSPHGDSPEDLLSGIRVLDLTRVIAGPVCTRTLALLGADVLRIDPPGLPEPEWQHYDTGHGKRSVILNARTDTFHGLVDSADVIVLGYRPAALQRLGLSAQQLHARNPGAVIAEISAWGADAPDRAGFDSLVQAESGIAMIESADGSTPGALPAQALDHSAGYLLAAGIIAMLDRRARAGGGWSVSTSLRRVAAELLGMPRTVEPAPQKSIDPASHTATFAVGGHAVTTVRPALPGVEFRAPRPWGSDSATW